MKLKANMQDRSILGGYLEVNGLLMLYDGGAQLKASLLDAKKALDVLSKDLKPSGIESAIALMLWLTEKQTGKQYFGKHNAHAATQVKKIEELIPELLTFVGLLSCEACGESYPKTDAGVDGATERFCSPECNAADSKKAKAKKA